MRKVLGAKNLGGVIFLKLRGGSFEAAGAIFVLLAFDFSILLLYTNFSFER